MTLGRDTAFPR
ncbi:hypothetical protein YPPY16_4533, partial [Yersinia pestis PY-16]